jgi:hypothetical protein
MLDAGAKKELNNALGVVDENNPIYFIAVSRNPRAKLTTAEWEELKDILKDICGDTIGLTKSIAYSNMHDYIDAHKDELKGSCKFVVFSEHFFWKKNNK